MLTPFLLQTLALSLGLMALGWLDTTFRHLARTYRRPDDLDSWTHAEPGRDPAPAAGDGRHALRHHTCRT